MSHYLALWQALQHPLLNLMRVDVRHAPWADLISAGLLVWRPHRRSPWLTAPPGHARRIRPVMGEVDLTAPALAIVADVDRAGALIGQQQAALAPLPHRCEGWQVLQQDLQIIWQTDARHLSADSQRLAHNTSVVREQAPAVRPVCDGTPGSVPSDDVVGRWYRRPHAHALHAEAHISTVETSPP